MADATENLGNECGRIPGNLDAAIDMTLPTRPGQRHRRLFDFCRALKSVPEYANMGADDLWDEFCAWHDRAEPFTSGHHSRLESWDEFFDGWERVEYPMGTDRVPMVLKRARLRPHLPQIERHADDRLFLMANICAELQDLSGDRPFFLSVRKAAELVGLANLSAWRLLRVLVRAGVLQIEEPGTRGPKGRATRYRYVGSKKNL